MAYLENYRPGREYDNATLANVKWEKEVAEIVLEWLKRPKHILVVQGPTGTGKTYFCSAVLREIWNKPYSVRYYKCRDFINYLKNSDISGGYEERTRSICESPKIILDDLGFNLNTEWQKDVINLFLDERSECLSSTATIITTNLNEEETKELYGYRFHSRLYDKRNTIVALDGRDLRLTGIK